MDKIIWLISIILIVNAAPSADKMNKVPVLLLLIKGFADSYSTDVYSGFLNTGNNNRSLHYLFV